MNNYHLEKDEPGMVRVAQIEPDEWIIEATDNNGVWILAEPGVTYATKPEAERSAQFYLP